MNWIDTLTMTVAALAGLECIAGRIGAMDKSKHKRTWLLGYWLAACVCFLAASLIWQGQDAALLDLAAWGVAFHLALTRREWIGGPPPHATRERPAYMQTDLMVSAPMVGRRDVPLDPHGRDKLK